LFNDAWVSFFLWAGTCLMVHRYFPAGAFLWSVAVGVKITALLALPAIGLIAIQGLGLTEAIYVGMYCIMVQLISAITFVEAGNTHYFQRAFDFGRQFEFKWTVNWRFLGEETFLDRNFQISLLVVHVSLLLAFIQYRWVRPSSTGIGNFIYKYCHTMEYRVEQGYIKKVTATYVMDTILASLAIGLLCARTLHYQFYAYLGWISPYLLWRAGFHPILVYANLAVQEWAWLVYPSTDVSSMLAVGQLVVAVASAWVGSAREPAVKEKMEEEPETRPPVPRIVVEEQ